MERITVARRLRNPRTVSHSIMFLAIRRKAATIFKSADPVIKGDQ